MNANEFLSFSMRLFNCRNDKLLDYSEGAPLRVVKAYQCWKRTGIKSNGLDKSRPYT
jgi:hypothetical protein